LLSPEREKGKRTIRESPFLFLKKKRGKREWRVGPIESSCCFALASVSLQGREKGKERRKKKKKKRKR